MNNKSTRAVPILVLFVLAGCLTHPQRQRANATVFFGAHPKDTGILIRGRIFEDERFALCSKTDKSLWFRIVNCYDSELLIQNDFQPIISLWAVETLDAQGNLILREEPGMMVGRSGHREQYARLRFSIRKVDGTRDACGCGSLPVSVPLPDNLYTNNPHLANIELLFFLDYYVVGDPKHYTDWLIKKVTVYFK